MPIAFRSPFPDQLQHAQALVRDGWEPDGRVRPGEILATVRKRDTLQHVEVETWATMHLMLLAQKEPRHEAGAR